MISLFIWIVVKFISTITKSDFRKESIKINWWKYGNKDNTASYCRRKTVSAWPILIMLLYATPYQEHTENRLIKAGFDVQSIRLWIILLIDDSHWLWKILSEARGLYHRKEKPSAAHKGGSIFIVRRSMHTCVKRCVITHFTQDKETFIKDSIRQKAVYSDVYKCVILSSFF